LCLSDDGLIDHPVFAARDVVDYLAPESAKPFSRFFVPGFNPLRFRVHEVPIAFAIPTKEGEQMVPVTLRRTREGIGRPGRTALAH
jgi:hypothetical protein